MMNMKRQISGFGSARVRTAAGFTLVEILVALGIFSMVLVAIFSTWTSILRAAKVGTEAAAAVQRARMAGRTLEEALGSTMLFVANRPYYTFLSENGSEGYLEFTTRLAPSFPRSGKFGGLDVRRIRFSIQQHDGDRQFVLQQWPYLMDMDKDEQNFPLVLAKHVREFKSEFWDTKTKDWIDEWTKTNELPVMVRVTLKIAENEISTRVQQQVCRIVSLPSIGVSPAWQTAGAPGAPAFPGAPGNPLNPAANPVNSGNPAFPNNPGVPGNPQFQNPGGYPNYPRQ